MYKSMYKHSAELPSASNSEKFILHRADSYLKPFLNYLYTKMDVRLVRAFFDAFMGILAHRDKSRSLLLTTSEFVIRSKNTEGY